MRIVLVEDDNSIALGIKRALERESYEVNWLAAGQRVLDTCREFMPEILILDLGLPDIDGITLLGQLRAAGFSLPVLVLTARDDTQSKVSALDDGADDYLTKPFELPELLARLRVLSRRQGTVTSSELVVGEVVLDLAAHTVTVAGEPVSLSRREYRILSALMENRGRILTKEALSQKLYGWGEEVASNTIEVHISNLRKKLPDGVIKTVRGVGYLVDKASQREPL